MGYTKETLKGMSWVWALRFLTRGASFLKIIVIARILTPNLFGLYGIATLVLSFVEVFTESGINIFIIQEKEDLKKIVSTAWFVSIVRGFLIFLLILLSAPLVSAFFNAPNSYYLIVLISIVPLIRGFINPSIVKFQQELQFRSEFFFRGAVFVLEALFSIIFVYVLKDPAGIIYGFMIGALFEVIISFLFVKPRPTLEVDREKIKKLFSRGKWLTLGGIFNYLYHNIDDAIVGKILGPASLGIYDMAYRLSMLPITEVGETVSKVIFPVYAKISDDKARLRRAFVRTMLGTFFFTIPVGIIFFVFAEPLVVLILGSQWIEAAPVVQTLAIFGVIRTLLNPAYSLFLSVKKQEYNTAITFISFIVMIVTIIPLLSYYGILGAAYSVILGSICAIPLTLYYLFIVFKKKYEGNI